MVGTIGQLCRRALGGAGAIAVAGALLVSAVPPADAAGPVPVECDTVGTLEVAAATGATTWELHLEGVCSGDLDGATITTVDGAGTSVGAGLCDGSVLVRDLVLDVVVTERDVVTRRTVQTAQTWTVPVATYPVASAFLIDGEASGAGVLASRIFARCGETGSPAARAIFTFTS